MYHVMNLCYGATLWIIICAVSWARTYDIMSSSIDDSQSRSPKTAPIVDPSTQRTIQTIKDVAPFSV